MPVGVRPFLACDRDASGTAHARGHQGQVGEKSADGRERPVHNHTLHEGEGSTKVAALVALRLEHSGECFL